MSEFQQMRHIGATKIKNKPYWRILYTNLRGFDNGTEIEKFQSQTKKSNLKN
jgi:hypothetical protein